MTTVNINKRDKYGDTFLENISTENIPRIGEFIYFQGQSYEVIKVSYILLSKEVYNVELICEEIK